MSKETKGKTEGKDTERDPGSGRGGGSPDPAAPSSASTTSRRAQSRDINAAMASGGGGASSDVVSVEHAATTTLDPSIFSLDWSRAEPFLDPALIASLDRSTSQLFPPGDDGDVGSRYVEVWQEAFRTRWSAHTPADECFLEDFLRQWNTAAQGWIATHGASFEPDLDALTAHVEGQMRGQARGDDADLALKFLGETALKALQETRLAKESQARLEAFAKDNLELMITLAATSASFLVGYGAATKDWEPFNQAVSLIPKIKLYEGADFTLKLDFGESKAIKGEPDASHIGIAPKVSAEHDFGGGFKGALGVDTNLRLAPETRDLFYELAFKPSIEFTRRFEQGDLKLELSGDVKTGNGQTPVSGGARLQVTFTFGGKGKGKD